MNGKNKRRKRRHKERMNTKSWNAQGGMNKAETEHWEKR